jgi:hypothetical protein
MNLTAGSKFTIRPGSILPVILLDKSYWANFWLNLKKIIILIKYLNYIYNTF